MRIGVSGLFIEASAVFQRAFRLSDFQCAEPRSLSEVFQVCRDAQQSGNMSAIRKQIGSTNRLSPLSPHRTLR